jgi:hypothetical protein
MKREAEAGISVVVASTARTAAFLPATLAAILAQTRPSDDVIVADDGSLQSLPPLPPQQLRRLRLLQGAGEIRPDLRNAGLAVALGRQVAFCDSGDLWKPGYLAAMAEMWRAEPGLLLACGDTLPIRGESWGSTRSFAHAPNGFWDGQRSLGPLMSIFDQPPMLRLLDYQPFFPSCLVADRDFLNTVGGWDVMPERRTGCDLATALRMAAHAPFGIMHRALVGIRPNPASPATAQEAHVAEACVLEHALATHEALRPHEALVRVAIAGRRQAALGIAFERGDFAAMHDMAALLPSSERAPPTRLRLGVAALPAPLRRAAVRGLGSLRGAARWSMK